MYVKQLKYTVEYYSAKKRMTPYGWNYRSLLSGINQAQTSTTWYHSYVEHKIMGPIEE
jgi:hypothetical protein